MDSTQKNYHLRFAYGKLMEAPNWVTFRWHILPISQDYYKIGYVGVKYFPNNPNFTSKQGPPNDTELQIKEIKLELLNRHYH